MIFRFYGFPVPVHTGTNGLPVPVEEFINLLHSVLTNDLIYLFLIVYCSIQTDYQYGRITSTFINFRRSMLTGLRSCILSQE